MLPSFVNHLPDGRESGTFIALDLGGTNFRVLLIDINDEQIDMDSQIYRIPSECMTGSGILLFDHIAKCMSDFITRMGFHTKLVSCGFTFSFPCEQNSIKSASLISWTKGFCAAGVEGKDVVVLLQEVSLKLIYFANFLEILKSDELPITTNSVGVEKLTTQNLNNL